MVGEKNVGKIYCFERRIPDFGFLDSWILFYPGTPEDSNGRTLLCGKCAILLLSNVFFTGFWGTKRRTVFCSWSNETFGVLMFC